MCNLVGGDEEWAGEQVDRMMCVMGGGGVQMDKVRTVWEGAVCGCKGAGKMQCGWVQYMGCCYGNGPDGC